MLFRSLSQAASKVVSWGTELASKGAAAAKQLFDSVVNGLKSLPDKIKEVGSNIVSGLWNGISSGWDWLKNKVANLASSLLDAAKDALASTRRRQSSGTRSAAGSLLASVRALRKPCLTLSKTCSSRRRKWSRRCRPLSQLPLDLWT